MFSSKFQGSSSGLELYSAAGSGDSAFVTLVGYGQREYDKSVKGYVLLLERPGRNNCIQSPATGSSGPALGIVQPLLVLQMLLQPGAPCSIEIGVMTVPSVDNTNSNSNSNNNAGALVFSRKRIYLSTAFRDFECNELHVKMPWNPLHRTSWANFVINLDAVVKRSFSHTNFHSLEYFVIKPQLRVRKIFTLPSSTLNSSSSSSSSSSGYDLYIAPAFQFPSGVPFKSYLYSQEGELDLGPDAVVDGLPGGLSVGGVQLHRGNSSSSCSDIVNHSGTNGNNSSSSKSSRNIPGNARTRTPSPTPRPSHSVTTTPGNSNDDNISGGNNNSSNNNVSTTNNSNSNSGISARSTLPPHPPNSTSKASPNDNNSSSNNVVNSNNNKSNNIINNNSKNIVPSSSSSSSSIPRLLSGIRGLSPTISRSGLASLEREYVPITNLRTNSSSNSYISTDGIGGGKDVTAPIVVSLPRVPSRLPLDGGMSFSDSVYNSIYESANEPNLDIPPPPYPPAAKTATRLINHDNHSNFSGLGDLGADSANINIPISTDVRIVDQKPINKHSVKTVAAVEERGIPSSSSSSSSAAAMHYLVDPTAIGVIETYKVRDDVKASIERDRNRDRDRDRDRNDHSTNGGATNKEGGRQRNFDGDNANGNLSLPESSAPEDTRIPIDDVTIIQILERNLPFDKREALFSLYTSGDDDTSLLLPQSKPDNTQRDAKPEQLRHLLGQMSRELQEYQELFGTNALLSFIEGFAALKLEF